jgi:TolB protein
MSMLLAATWAWTGGPAAADPRGTMLLISSSATYGLDPASGQLVRQIANGADGVVSPNRTRVAYVRDLDPCAVPEIEGCRLSRDLLTADLSGGDERAVAHTADAVDRYSPDWSPDGSRILFSWSWFDEIGLSWVRPDGSGLETLAFGAGRARFSPDGKKIAYVQGGNIYLMNVVTRQTRALTSDGDVDGYAPDWSPDGDRIAYTSWQAVHVVDVKTGASVNLTDGWTAAVDGMHTAVFSPDGNQIAFAAADISAYPDGDAVARIYTVDAAGGQPRAIADTGGDLTDWVRM